MAKTKSLYERMKDAAKDLNEVIGFEEPIPINIKKDALKGMLIKAFAMADPDDPGDQEISDETILLMEEIGADVLKWMEVPTENESGKESDKTEEETEEETTETEKEETEEETTETIEIHPYADLIPEMDDDQYRDFKKDIEENGLNDPIEMFDGKIIDGKHRYRACYELGVKAEFTDYDGDPTKLLEYIISKNIRRRHLTPAQRATIAADLLPKLEKIGKQKQAKGGKSKSKTGKPFRAAEEAAKITGSTKNAVTTAKKVKEKDPKKFKEMKQGKKTLASAKRETKEKTDTVVFEDSEKVFKTKLKNVIKTIHEFVDVAELTNTEITYIGDLDLIESSINNIIK